MDGRLKELGVGPVPAAGVPVVLGSGVVAGTGAGVEGPGGGGQASDGGRVDARALRAREDRGDRLDELADVFEDFRACDELLLVSAHDPCLPLRNVTLEGTGARPRRNRSESFGATP